MHLVNPVIRPKAKKNYEGGGHLWISMKDYTSGARKSMDEGSKFMMVICYHNYVFPKPAPDSRYTKSAMNADIRMWLI